MKESTQTFWFVAVATASVLLAVFSEPSDATFDADSLRGQPLTTAFLPDEAKSLKIVKYDEATAEVQQFEVIERDGVWTIPSKQGYPADAVQQMAEASTTVMDREILALATQSAADHEEYGVIDPSSSIEPGQSGVGTRVSLAKGDGSVLADLIIGKEVKDASEQRYVRRATQDVVFVVEIDPESLTTSFEDWIEDDLLGLNTFDIQSVRIKDYTSELVQQGMRIGVVLDQRADMQFRYDDEKSEWVAEELLEFNNDSRAFEPLELADDQTLNTDALNELKNSLDDLRIIDVEKKPNGLSADLKAGDDFFDNNASALNLMGRGFAPTMNESGESEVLSTEGEVVCTLSDGVEYVLRFGNLQVSEGEEDAAPDTEGDDESRDDLNRYLFVMARYNGSVIEPPELETIPELTAAAEEPTDNEEASASDQSESQDENNEPAADEPPSEAEEEADAESDQSTESDNAAESLKADREAIIARNQREQDRYDDKVAKAKQRVEELNARFGDWYYVVSNDVFEKVRLGRDDVIQQNESEETADGGDAPFGAPGSTIPGLPNLPGLNSSTPATGTESAPEAESAAEAGVTADDAEPATESEGESAEPESTETSPETDSEDSGAEE